MNLDPNESFDDWHCLKLREELDFSARGRSRHVELPCRGRAVLLERLRGHERISIGVAGFDERKRDGLLLRRVVIVGVDEVFESRKLAPLMQLVAIEAPAL